MYLKGTLKAVSSYKLSLRVAPRIPQIMTEFKVQASEGSINDPGEKRRLIFLVIGIGGSYSY